MKLTWMNEFGDPHEFLKKGFSGLCAIILFHELWTRSGIAAVSYDYRLFLIGLGLAYGLDSAAALLAPSRGLQSRVGLLSDVLLLPLLIVIVSWRNWGNLYMFLRVSWIVFTVGKLWNLIGPLTQDQWKRQRISLSVRALGGFLLSAYLTAPLYVQNGVGLGIRWDQLLVSTAAAFLAFWATGRAGNFPAMVRVCIAGALFFSPTRLFFREHDSLVLGFYLLAFIVLSLNHTQIKSTLAKAVIMAGPTSFALTYGLIAFSHSGVNEASRLGWIFLNPARGLVYLSPLLLFPLSVFSYGWRKNYARENGYTIVSTAFSISVALLVNIRIPDEAAWIVSSALIPQLLFFVLVWSSRLNQGLLQAGAMYSFGLSGSALLLNSLYPGCDLDFKNMILCWQQVFGDKALWLTANEQLTDSNSKVWMIVGCALSLVVVVGLRLGLTTRFRTRSVSPHLVLPGIGSIAMLIMYLSLHSPSQYVVRPSESVPLTQGNPEWRQPLNLDFPVTMLRITSSMARSLAVPQDMPVAEIALRYKGESLTRLILKAGVDTAEWAYERPDVQPRIRHDRPQIAYSWPVHLPSGTIFHAHTYSCDHYLKLPLYIDELVVSYICVEEVDFLINQIVCYDLSNVGLQAMSIPKSLMTLSSDLPKSVITLPHPKPIKAIRVKSTLANAAELSHGLRIAAIRLFSSTGELIDARVMRCGIDTAEWAYDRVDLRNRIAHARPRNYQGIRVRKDHAVVLENRYSSTLVVGSDRVCSTLEFALTPELCQSPQASLTIHDLEIL